jgi:uncharacterized protein (DUF1697 family)
MGSDEAPSTRRPRIGPNVCAGLVYISSLADEELKDKKEGVFSKKMGFEGERILVRKAITYLQKLIEWHDRKMTPDKETVDKDARRYRDPPDDRF